MPESPKEFALFVTCLADLLRPSVGFAAIKLIKDAGCAVTVPNVRKKTGAAHVATPPEHVIRARSQSDQETQTNLFIEMAEGVATSIARIPSLADVACFLARHNLPHQVKPMTIPCCRGSTGRPKPLWKLHLAQRPMYSGEF